MVNFTAIMHFTVGIQRGMPLLSLKPEFLAIIRVYKSLPLAFR